MGKRLNEKEFLARFSSGFREMLPVAHEAVQGLQLTAGLYRHRLPQIHVTSVGRFSQRTKSVPDNATLAQYARMKIQDDPVFLRLAETLNEYTIVGRHFVTTPGPRYNYDTLRPFMVIQDALRYYLDEHGAFSGSHYLILRIGKRIAEHFRKPFIEYTHTTYLENLTFTSVESKIDKDLRIEALSQTDIELLYNSTQHFRDFYSGYWIGSLGRIGARLRLTTRSRKQKHTRKLKPGIGEREVEQVLNNALGAFRLVSPSQINRSPVVWSKLDLPFFNHEHTHGMNEYQVYDERLDLNAAQMRPVRNIYRGIVRSVKHEPTIASILYRLHLSSRRYNFEDRVIDDFIILELILRTCTTEGFGMQTSSQAMAVVVAKLASRIKEQQSFAYDVVRKAYKIRNRIVHAKKTTKDELATIRQLERVLRAAVRRLVTARSLPKVPLKEWLL